MSRFRTGDDVIFSFRLQPGTAARVNQSQNRLDVVFATSPKSPNAAIPRPTTLAAPNASPDLAGPPLPATRQVPRDARGASDVREGNTSINSNSKESITNSASTGVLSALEPSNTASTSPSTSPGSQTAVSDKGSLAPWSGRRSLSVLVGLLVLGGVALLFRRYNRKDTGWQATELNIKPMAVNEGMSEASLANPTSLAAAPTSVARLSAATSQGSLEIENDLAAEEASLLRQEQALRRQAEVLEAKQLAAEKTRKEIEACGEFRAELTTPLEHSSLQVTSHPEVVASLQEENRYRRGGETLRKAAEELARMRQAAEAVRKAEEEKVTRTAEEEMLTRIADLKMFTKKTASN